MARLQPFRGIRPRSDRAGDIIAPPYDVVDRAEARAILARQPDSFLQVTRPDATLPDSVDEHAPEIYAQGRGALDAMLADGRVVQDDRPCFYLYSQTWRGHTQTGLMALCSVAEYDEGRIKRHELTRPDKEQDRVDHIEALDCQTGLVFLAYRDDDDAVKAAMVDAAAQPPAWSATTDDGVTHSLRVVAEPLLVERIQSAFAHLPALYVADGHHRSAAASRVAASRRGRAPAPGSWPASSRMASCRSWPTTAWSWTSTAGTPRPSWPRSRPASPSPTPIGPTLPSPAPSPSTWAASGACCAPTPTACPPTTRWGGWMWRCCRTRSYGRCWASRIPAPTPGSALSAAFVAPPPWSRRWMQGRRRWPSTSTRPPWPSSLMWPTQTA